MHLPHLLVARTLVMAHLGPHLAPLAPEDGDPEGGLVISPVREPFDIEDFTSASDWERFVANIEGSIREWGMADAKGEQEQVPNKDERPGRKQVWCREKRNASYLGFDFNVVRHTLRDEEDEDDKTSTEKDKDLEEEKPEVKMDFGQGDKENLEEEEEEEDKSLPLSKALQEMMHSSLDFPAGSHPAHYFFGCTDFILLSPAGGREEVDTPSRARVALSAAAVAASDTRCRVPVLVQVMARPRAQFAGVLASREHRTELEMAVLPRRSAAAAADCAHLQDLLRIFRERLSRPLACDVPQGRVSASVRKTFLLEDWAGLYQWAQAPPDLELLSAFGDSSEDDLASLPLGSTSDPVKRLVLNADWPKINEALVIENGVHDDFDPREAPKWSVAVTFDDNPDNLLGTSFFLKTNFFMQMFMSRRIPPRLCRPVQAPRDDEGGPGRGLLRRDRRGVQQE